MAKEKQTEKTAVVNINESVIKSLQAKLNQLEKEIQQTKSKGVVKYFVSLKNENYYIYDLNSKFKTILSPSNMKIVLPAKHSLEARIKIKGKPVVASLIDDEIAKYCYISYVDSEKIIIVNPSNVKIELPVEKPIAVAIKD